MQRLFLQSAFLALLAGLPVPPVPQSQQDSGQKQPDKQDQKQPDSKQQDERPSGDSSSSSSSSAGAAEELRQADQGQKYDPLPAEKDVDVGEFYMHKGDLDAAIARFEDAIQLKANYAKPRLLLAQIYEKKEAKRTR